MQPSNWRPEESVQPIRFRDIEPPPRKRTKKPPQRSVPRYERSRARSDGVRDVMAKARGYMIGCVVFFVVVVAFVVLMFSDSAEKPRKRPRPRPAAQVTRPSTTRTLRPQIRLRTPKDRAVVDAGNTTEETVTVLLGESQSEGNLMIKRRQVVLTEMNRLAATVDVSPPQIKTDEPVGGRMLRQAGFRS